MADEASTMEKTKPPRSKFFSPAKLTGLCIRRGIRRATLAPPGPGAKSCRALTQFVWTYLNSEVGTRFHCLFHSLSVCVCAGLGSGQILALAWPGFQQVWILNLVGRSANAHSRTVPGSMQPCPVFCFWRSYCTCTGVWGNSITPL